MTIRDKFEQKVTSVRYNSFLIDGEEYGFDNFDSSYFENIKESHHFEEFKYCLFFLLDNKKLSDPQSILDKILNAIHQRELDERCEKEDNYLKGDKDFQAIINRCIVLIRTEDDVFDAMVYCIKYAINNPFFFMN